MTAPAAGTTGWFKYDPAYNAVMTQAELDLFQRLQKGDAVLMGAYADRYGNPCSPSGFCGPALEAWQRDQDYWNVRYLNQLAPPEELDRLQQYTGGEPYNTSIFICNAMQQMQREGTLQAYLNGFKDSKFAGYLAQTCMGLTNVTVTQGGGPIVVGTATPTPAIGPQPTAPAEGPTFVPTETGQGPTGTAQPPTPYGPIQPAPTDATGMGPTTVPPTSTAPTGVGPSPTMVPTGVTPTPTIHIAPSGPIPSATSLGGIPVWAIALVGVGALLLFMRGRE